MHTIQTLFVKDNQKILRQIERNKDLKDKTWY